MKIIQALVVLFAVVGCLALALGGFFVYQMSQSGEDNFLTRLKQSRAAETTATVAAAATPAPVAASNSEYANIIREYQPTPTPAPQVVAGAPGQPATMVASAVVTPAAKPIKTPSATEGKIRSWATGRKYVALTYDDGPHPEWTPKMIELLRSKNVKATFFLLGNMIEKHPEIGKSLADNGFEIANHTVTHPDFNKSAMTVDKIRSELQTTNELIAQHITREPVRVMRPPFGNTPKKLEEVCAEMRIQIIAWNIDTDDWRSSTNADKMADNVIKNLSDGAIILMHDRHQKTYDCTAKIIDQIREQGYEFVTVSELLGLVPVGGVPAAQVAAAPAAVPAGAAPAAAVAPAGQASLPAPSAAVPAAAAAPTPALPVPAAAQTATPVPGPMLDSSKITQPPPQR